jgi:acyl-CoA thioesterase I
MWEGNLTRYIIIPAIAWIFLFGGCSKSRTDETPKTQPGSTAASINEEQDDRPVLVAFGDSLTAGAGVDASRNYPAQLQKKIDAAGYRYRVVNAGVSGETSAQGLQRIQSVLDLRPAIAIIEFGANDGLRGMPVEATRRNLAAMVNRLKSAGAEVVLAGMEIPPNYGPQYTGSFREIYRQVAKEHGIALIPFFLEGVGGYARLNQDDGIHPTVEGYAIVVENVWRVLRPLL